MASQKLREAGNLNHRPFLIALLLAILFTSLFLPRQGANSDPINTPTPTLESVGECEEEPEPDDKYMVPLPSAVSYPSFSRESLLQTDPLVMQTLPSPPFEPPRA